jgi:hypothetical protein
MHLEFRPVFTLQTSLKGGFNSRDFEYITKCFDGFGN